MKFKIQNTESKKTYDVNVTDENQERRSIHKKAEDEQICSKCNKPLSECQCEKEHEEVHDKEEKEEKIELNKEEHEAFKELLELLPDLKKLLGGERNERQYP